MRCIFFPFPCFKFAADLSFEAGVLQFRPLPLFSCCPRWFVYDSSRLFHSELSDCPSRLYSPLSHSACLFPRSFGVNISVIFSFNLYSLASVILLLCNTSQLQPHTSALLFACVQAPFLTSLSCWASFCAMCTLGLAPHKLPVLSCLCHKLLDFFFCSLYSNLSLDCQLISGYYETDLLGAVLLCCTTTLVSLVHRSTHTFGLVSSSLTCVPANCITNV